MYFIYSLIVVTLLVLLFTKSIRNHAKIFYFIASVMAILTTVYEILRLTSNIELNGFIGTLERVSMKGHISIAFFVLVMFAGALNPRWNLTKKLLSIRAELAILGSIFILPHCIMYFARFIILKLIPGKPLKPLYVTYLIIGIIAFLIMIPLFINSFKKIRIKIKYNDWKKLQRFAYLFYFLTYIHILVLSLNKLHKKSFDLIIYTIVFATYLILKLIKTFSYKHKFKQ